LVISPQLNSSVLLISPHSIWQAFNRVNIGHFLEKLGQLKQLEIFVTIYIHHKIWFTKNKV